METATQKLGKEPRYPLSEAALLAGTSRITLRRWVAGSASAPGRSAQPPLIDVDGGLTNPCRSILTLV